MLRCKMFSTEKSKYFIVAALLFSLLLVGAKAPRAQEPQVIRVAFSIKPPWRTLEKNGLPGGTSVDLLELIAQEMGLTLEYKLTPFARGLLMLEAGQADIMIGILRSPEREKYLYFLEPPINTHSDKAFYVRRDSRIDIQKYEDLYGKRIATGIKKKYFPRFDRDKELLKEAGPKNFASNLRKLLHGRVDVVIDTELVGDYQIVRSGLGGKIRKCTYVHRKPNNVYIAMSRQSAHVGRREDFKRVLEKLLKANVKEKILEKHLKKAAHRY